MRRRWIAITAMLVVLLGVAIAWVAYIALRPAPESPVVRVGYKKNSAYMNLFVAEERRLFEKAGLRLQTEEFEDTNVMIQALAAGRIDATPNSNLEAICLAETQAPGAMKIYLVAYWTAKKPFSYLLVREDSPINSVERLAGKKIGTLPGLSPHTWCVMIFRNYFDIDEDNIVAISPKVQLQALASGRVDALLTVPPINVIGELKGISRTLASGLEAKHIMDPFPAAAGVLSARMLRERPRTAARFIQAMDSAVDFMRTRPDDTRSIIAQYTGWGEQVCSRLDVYDYWKLNEVDFKKTQRWVDIMTEEGILKKPISVRSLLVGESAIR